MVIRLMANSAIHFAGGMLLGVLAIFAAKGAADLLPSDRSMVCDGGSAKPPPPDSPPSGGSDQAEVL